MKNNDFKDFDLSNFIELTEDQLRFEVNGGSKSSGSKNTGSVHRENTNHAVANAKPGDTITRNNGTKVTLTKGDISWAKAHDNTPTTTPENQKQTSKTSSTRSKERPHSSESKREAGYVMDNNAVYYAGHAGMYVQNDDDSYDFFEVTPYNEMHESGEVTYETVYYNDSEHDMNESNLYPIRKKSYSVEKKVLTCGSIGSVESRLTFLLGRETLSGVKQYHFEQKKDMMDYLSKLGKSGGFDSYIQFEVPDDKNETIFNNAVTMGKSFSDYDLLGNNCGIWAKKVLTEGDTGISSMSILKEIGAAGALLGAAKKIPQFLWLPQQLTSLRIMHRMP